MTTTQWIGLAIKFSLMVIVFCIALNTQRGDLATLLRQPGLWVRSMVAMNVVMPLIAALLAAAFALTPQIKVALIALAVSPVPPILPNKLIKAGASRSYAVTLLLLSAVVAIVMIPLSINLLGRVFDLDIDVPPAAVFNAVALSVLVPLIAGVIVRTLAPNLAAKIVKPLAMVANTLLVAALLPVLVVAWPQLAAQVGNFTLVTIVALVLAGLLVGHVLGGPDPGNRTALALSTASRHPGVAVAVAGIIFPNDKSVAMAVLLAFLVSIFVTIPYGKWRERMHAPQESKA